MTRLGFLVTVLSACRAAADAEAVRAATDPLLAARRAGAGTGDDDLMVARGLIEAAAGRLTAEARLSDLTARVDSAQELANMGDFDWDIASDITVCSDQLYRIFGVEPLSFDPAYEVYLAHLHPDDQEGSREVHRRALATAAPYQRISRLIRPDGELRYLSSTGEILSDGDGVVVLDLAMPVMDGLEALPLIKAAVPDVKVIVLSGFDQGPMRDRAILAGASRYVEKGVRMGLPGHIDEVVGPS